MNTLGDWDLLAFDNNGNSCTGYMTDSRERTLEVSTNALLIFNADTAEDDFEPIARVYSGTSVIEDFNIHITRGPQDAICFIAVDIDGNILAGCGCSQDDINLQAMIDVAGINESDWDSVILRPVDPFTESYDIFCSREGGISETGEVELDCRVFSIPKEGNEILGPRKVGMVVETRQFFMNFLHQPEHLALTPNYTAWLKNVEASIPIVLNQQQASLAKLKYITDAKEALSESSKFAAKLRKSAKRAM